MFRSKLIYPAYLKPDSSTGSFELALRAEQSRPLKQPFRALIFGDSQIGEGFSAPIADHWAEPYGVEFANVASPGAMLRTSYYLIRDLDPEAKRYNILLVGLRDYADIDAEDKNDRPMDLNWVIARLRLTDVLSFAASYDDWRLQWRAIEGGLLKGIVYRADLRDLMRHWRERERDLRKYNKDLLGSRDAYGGNSGSLTGLSVDFKTGQVQIPSQISAQVARELKARLLDSPASAGHVESAYRRRWLLPLIQRYTSHSGLVIIYRIPQLPVHKESKFRCCGSFIESARTYPHVVLVDEHRFDDLEQPSNFFDGAHMNAQGRASFSKRLAEATVECMRSWRSVSSTSNLEAARVWHSR